MITVKDFATQQGCGESIIYRHIRNHKEALGDRVQKQNGRTWLTDEGADYIRGLMKQAPVVISETSDVVEHLRNENKQLLEALNAAKDRIIDLQGQNTQYAIENAKIALLEADNEAARVKMAETEKNAQKVQNELTEAKEEYKRLDERNRMTENNLKDAQERLGVIQSKWWYKLFAEKGKE